MHIKDGELHAWQMCGLLDMLVLIVMEIGPLMCENMCIQMLMMVKFLETY